MIMVIFISLKYFLIICELDISIITPYQKCLCIIKFSFRQKTSRYNTQFIFSYLMYKWNGKDPAVLIKFQFKHALIMLS